MFMVGGGILLHGWPALAHAVEHYAAGFGELLGGVIGTAAGAGLGVAAGALVLAGVTLAQRLRR
jgi:predicted DNA repair protein MutK